MSRCTRDAHLGALELAGVPRMCLEYESVLNNQRTTGTLSVSVEHWNVRELGLKHPGIWTTLAISTNDNGDSFVSATFGTPLFQDTEFIDPDRARQVLQDHMSDPQSTIIDFQRRQDREHWKVQGEAEARRERGD